jgi:hypothetical protein
MTRVRSSLICAVLFSGSAMAAQAQRVASGSEQVAFELSAASHLSAQGTSQFSGAGLDPRFYSATAGNALAGGRFAAWQGPEGGHFVVPLAHREGHLRELAQAIGARGRIDDSATCAMAAPAACRFGSFSAVVAFSPATIDGDLARLVISAFYRQSPSGRAGAQTSAVRELSAFWFVTFQREGTIWKVREVTTVRT